MRKIILLLTAIILLAPSILNAQPVVGGAMPVKIDLGLKLGANFASINGEEWEKSSKPGFLGGAFFSIGANRFGGQAEVLFSRVSYTGDGLDFYRAAKADDNFSNNADSTVKGDFAVSYLSIPLLLNVKVVGPLWFQVGPQFNNMIGISDKDNLLKDAKELFKSGEVSGVLGLQLNLANIRVGARYIVGLSDVSVSTAADTWKQRTIQLSLGFTFL